MRRSPGSSLTHGPKVNLPAPLRAALCSCGPTLFSNQDHMSEARARALCDSVLPMRFDVLPSWRDGWTAFQALIQIVQKNMFYEQDIYVGSGLHPWLDQIDASLAELRLRIHDYVGPETMAADVAADDTVFAVCRHYAATLSLLFAAVKRVSRCYRNCFVFPVAGDPDHSGQLHAWVWFVDLDRGHIIPIEPQTGGSALRYSNASCFAFSLLRANRSYQGARTLMPLLGRPGSVLHQVLLFQLARQPITSESRWRIFDRLEEGNFDRLNLDWSSDLLVADDRLPEFLDIEVLLDCIDGVDVGPSAWPQKRDDDDDFRLALG